MKIQYSCDEKKTLIGVSNVAIHKDSHRISKGKPKIRIIHIVAPEIIKTDAANFRSLVQKLTGKSSGSSSFKKGKNNINSSQQKIKKAADNNPNGAAVLSFMHGMNRNEFPLPLLHFRSNNSQINTPAAHMPFF